jgi:hypothetical protein
VIELEAHDMSRFERRSVRLIDFVADTEAMVDETLLVTADVDVRFRPSLAVVDEHLVRALNASLVLDNKASSGSTIMRAVIADGRPR